MSSHSCHKSWKQFEQYKEDIHYHLEYDKALEEDDDLAQMTAEWLKVENGLGKLQDIKKQKKNLEMILVRRKVLVSCYLCP